jgi:hypothetical protein
MKNLILVLFVAMSAMLFSQNKINYYASAGLSISNTGAYLLLYPSFKHFRDDKGTANSLEDCVEIQNAALGLS